MANYIENTKQKDCYENPFVYGLIHTPANLSELYDGEFFKEGFDDCEYFAHETEAFRFVWNELCKEDSAYFDEYQQSFVFRTFDLPDRAGYITNRRTSTAAVDAPYPAQTLADLFEYSDGEQFYHSVNADDIWNNRMV